jgi:hypothetical protein
MIVVVKKLTDNFDPSSCQLLNSCSAYPGWMELCPIVRSRLDDYGLLLPLIRHLCTVSKLPSHSIIEADTNVKVRILLASRF